MKKYLLFLLMAMPLMLTSCSKDKDDVDPSSKIVLSGTWYTLEDGYGWVLFFTESTYTQYELYSNSEDYYILNDYTLTGNYSIEGRKITIDGETGSIVLNDNTFTITYKGESLTYTKFNGTPQQLIEHLNK